jgi:multisubunit Na+/H+ antiporter MnhC subunit
VAVAALLLWLCTAAVGSYLLVTAAHAGNNPANNEPEPAEPVSVPAERPAAARVDAAAPTAPPAPAPARRTRDDRDRVFAPPSLQQARSEPLPGMKDLAEFAHPALAMIGIGFWLGYVVSRDRLFAVIGLGILLGAICAGVTLFTVSTRAARRAAAAEAESRASAGTTPLIASPLVLIVHAIGATLTLLFAVLIVVRA